MISQEDVRTLAELSKLSITDEEVLAFRKTLSSVLDYVESITSITLEADDLKGSVTNVVRDDVVTEVSGKYTEEMLEAAPRREGSFFKTHKILSQDE